MEEITNDVQDEEKKEQQTSDETKDGIYAVNGVAVITRNDDDNLQECEVQESQESEKHGQT